MAARYAPCTMAAAMKLGGPIIAAIAIARAAQAQPAPEPAPAPAPEPATAPVPTEPAQTSAPTPAKVEAVAESKPPEELDPFAYSDWTWLSGNPRTKDSKLGNEFYTGEFRLDDVFHYSLNHP